MHIFKHIQKNDLLISFKLLYDKWEYSTKTVMKYKQLVVTRILYIAIYDIYYEKLD